MSENIPTGEQITAWNDIRPLPKKPGEYRSASGDLWWLDSDGWHNKEGSWLGFQAHACGPFTHLVPETSPIKREQIVALLVGYEAFSKGAQADAILALVNGIPNE